MVAKLTFEKAANLAGLNHKPGKQAVKRQYRNQINGRDNVSLVGSIDLDGHFKKLEPHANRWDYVVGFNGSKHFVIWIEPHPASGMSEVKTVLRKVSWLKGKLATEAFSGFSDLTDAAEGFGHKPYRWIYSGKSSYRVGGNEEKLLAKEGMRLPERNLTIG